MAEHRIATRRRVLKAGTILRGGDEIPCIVRSLSETGAALDVIVPLFIPDRFTLLIHSEHLRRSCHIVWRKERRMGIAFD